MGDAVLFHLFLSVLFFVELLEENVLAISCASGWTSSSLCLGYTVNVWWDISLILDGMPLVVYGSGYVFLFVYECWDFLSWNWLGFNSFLLRVINGWGFDNYGHFTAMLYYHKFFGYFQCCCYTFLRYLYEWLLQSDYGSYLSFWCGTLERCFLPNDNSFLDFGYASILISLKEEVIFLLFFSSHHSTFCIISLSFYYEPFSCWKGLFFAGDQIEVLFLGSINFIDGLSFFSFFLSLLFCALSLCHPSMFLGFHVFWISSGSSAHKIFFVFLNATLRSCSELKVPLSTLYFSFILTRSPYRGFP